MEKAIDNIIQDEKKILKLLEELKELYSELEKNPIHNIFNSLTPIPNAESKATIEEIIV